MFGTSLEAQLRSTLWSQDRPMILTSDSSDQLHSYAAQIRNYTSEISKHDGWQLVDIYANEGITAPA